MKNNFTPILFEETFNIEKIITIFYMELSKSFSYEGESHDFWEMVYIDKGEMICTADKNRFILKSGEMTFHKPNEFHNLSGNNDSAPNVSIITFECKSSAMKYFDGKIFKLNAEEKQLLSSIFSEGISCYKLEDEYNPLLQKMKQIENAPFGSSQMTKNLLEVFLIKLCRNSYALPNKTRRYYLIDGVEVPYNVKEILDVLNQNIYGRITIKDIAQKLSKSESAVKKIFAEYHGIIKHYNSLKISEAKRLIREERYNMSQISNMLMFDSPQYFSKCFKQFTKMTPSEYKASILGISNKD